MTATPESTPPTDVPALKPGDRVDRYRVDRKLGEGGMAAVYRVRHLTLGSLHALKVVSVASPTVAKRLLQEGRVQARLQHPNVVGVTDVIDVQGSPGLVLEYVAGPNLGELASELPPMTVEQLDHLVLGVLRGVEVAHGLGFAHRDLKPANVLVAESPDGPVPKVADFGLAKVLEGTALDSTRPNIAMGTPAYMAPEQIEDAKSADQRADLFSLGAILYELAAGRRCFLGNSIFEIFRKVGNADFVPLRSCRPDLPRRVHDAVAAALVVDRDQRVQSVAALRELWCGPGWSAPGRDPFGASLEPIFARHRPELEPFTPEPTPAPATRHEEHRQAGPPHDAAATPVLPPPRSPAPAAPTTVGGVTAIPVTAPPPAGSDAATVSGTVSDGEPRIDPARTTGSEPPRAGRSVALVAALGLGGLAATSALGVALAVAGGALGSGEPPPAAPAVEPARAGEPVRGPEPEAGPPLPGPVPIAASPTPPPARPTGPKPAAAAPEPAPSAPILPAPVPPTPAPSSPASPASPTGRVEVEGPARVWLVPVAGGARLAAGVVPVGDYKVEASFGDADPIPQGKLTVVDGTIRTLRCNAKLKTCR